MPAFGSMNPRTADPLQALIRLNRESQKCFRAAGDQVRDAELTALFYHYARQRTAFADELARAVTAQDAAQPPSDGAARAMRAVHRWWHAVRRRLVADEAALSLRLAVRAEDEVRQIYEEALREPPAPELSEILQRQHDEIAGAEDYLQSLRSARTPQGRLDT